MTTIERLEAGQAELVLTELVDLLQDAVSSGASVGYLPPLPTETARAYWQQAIVEVRQGARLILAAWHTGRLAGVVQLELCGKANGRHRAEVQKLMVHTAYRGLGLGKQLMTELEAVAQQLDLKLLVLDTRRGDVAEQLYLKLGYIQAGVIPQYALSARGSLEDTVIFYRLL